MWSTWSRAARPRSTTWRGPAGRYDIGAEPPEWSSASGDETEATRQEGDDDGNSDSCSVSARQRPNVYQRLLAVQAVGSYLARTRPATNSVRWVTVLGVIARLWMNTG